MKSSNPHYSSFRFKIAKNYHMELPDIISSVPLADSLFGVVNVEETRLQNNYLGSRHCKTTVDTDKGIKVKKPTKKLAEEELSVEVDEKQRAAMDEKRKNEIKNGILHEKDVFDRLLLATGGPKFRPALLHAHPNKRVDSSVKKSRLRQKQPFHQNDFSQAVLLNIIENLRKEYPVYLESPDVAAKPLCLQLDCTFEKAFNELLKTPDVEADDWTKTEVADTDVNNWKKITIRYMGKSRCRDSRGLMIEYACILPDRVHSTVFVSCRYCASVIQTTLDDETWKTVEADALYNLALTKHTTHSEQSSTSVSTTTIPGRSVLGKDMYVTTTIMGTRALVKKPSKLSILLRINMFVNGAPNSVISNFIHGKNRKYFVPATTDS